ncbi:e627c404-5e8d-4309-8740-a337659f9745-CDS [Sclerotinia trifoliorum]|uniref:E627c404-5e8d-4309-8740-a337659f9745-CDS n=1 Tax=Sclerotinia trifoliorum TaxID=28548 RepID=A0A8H2VZG7_9HELO|nr:e627c404-5e8d-4309-8740-a337659f9745-CDS [Sclerotinia trifoliorum]
MPSKQKSKPKGSAPATRIYKSVEPLHQTTFPEKKKRVTRGYGKKSAVKLNKQDTLTQMDWVKLYEREALEKEIEDDIEDSEGDYEQEESKRKTKRRRTMGDEPTMGRTKTSKNRRKTLGEEERTPSFSTQTITQLDYWPLSGASKELEDDPSIYDIPVSSPTAVQPPRRSPRNISQPATSASTGLMPPPQTPKHRRVLEIPSSQSPATPTSSRFGSSAQRRSPLREQSANIVVPFSLRSKTYMSAEKLPKLKVEDTYETGTDESQVVRTPSKHSSPPKTVRFAVPEPSLEPSPVNTPIKQEPATQRGFSPSSIRRGGISAPKNIKLEILDSDAEEDEEDEESQIIADTPVESISGYEDHTNVGDADENIAEPGQDDTQSNTGQIEGDEEKELELPETFYGDIGAETQFQVERIMSSSGLGDVKEDTPLCDDIPQVVPCGGSEYQQSQNHTTQHTQTQHHQAQLTQTYNQFGKSQYPESQRLSTQQLDAMAPRSDASDIFICIYPTHVENIISRKKNHEFRPYNFPSTVSRIWIYQTKPVSTLTHMAVISAPKSPGEITNHDGLGNAEFNKGDKRSKVAYEILELYALANPMTLKELKSRQWVKAVPQKYARVPPAVLSELIANLLPPLFVQSLSSLSPSETDASEGTHSTPILHRTSSTSTESHEIQDQITNNVQQFTQAQAPPSSPPLSTPTPAIHVPSSQNRSVKPSHASSVDYTQTQTPITPDLTHGESPIMEVIPESPMRSIPSSSRGSTPVLMLPPVMSRRVIEVESQNEDEDEGEEDNRPVVAMAHKRRVIEIESHSEDEEDEEENDEAVDEDENKDKDKDHSQHIGGDQEQEPHHLCSTPPPYSLIHSSQVMSRSQMMREQDSLMEEEIMGPPPSTMYRHEGSSWDEGGDEEL